MGIELDGYFINEEERLCLGFEPIDAEDSRENGSVMDGSSAADADEKIKDASHLPKAHNYSTRRISNAVATIQDTPSIVDIKGTTDKNVPRWTLNCLNNYVLLIVYNKGLIIRFKNEAVLYT